MFTRSRDTNQITDRQNRSMSRASVYSPRSFVAASHTESVSRDRLEQSDLEKDFPHKNRVSDRFRDRFFDQKSLNLEIDQKSSSTRSFFDQKSSNWRSIFDRRRAGVTASVCLTGTLTSHFTSHQSLHKQYHVKVFSETAVFRSYGVKHERKSS